MVRLVQDPVQLISTLTLVWKLLIISKAQYRNSIFPTDVTFPSAIANQESLSTLETEMRRIEGMVKEVESEMEYLRRREERFSSTNGEISRRMLECTVRFRVHLRKDSEQTRVD